MIADPSSFGWMLDGVCDGFGDIFRFIAFIIFLSKVWPSKKVVNVGGYNLLEIGGGILQKLWRPLLVVSMVGLQTLFSSILWNFFMINYHFLLETDILPGSYNLAMATKQNLVLKSSGMWMVCTALDFNNLDNPYILVDYILFSGLLFLAPREPPADHPDAAAGSSLWEGG